jgi:hypothetical protein
MVFPLDVDLDAFLSYESGVLTPPAQRSVLKERHVT